MSPPSQPHNRDAHQAGSTPAASDSCAASGEPGTSQRSARAWLLRVATLVLVAGLIVSALAKATLIGPLFGDVDLELEGGVQTLLVGASHAACAFNPEVLSGDALGQVVSVARQAELMLSTDAKLEALLDDNPGVRRVILAVSPIHMATWQDEHLFGRSPHSRAQIMDYYPLYGEHTRALLPLSNPDVLLAALKYDFGVPFNYTDDTGLYVRHLLGQMQPQHYRFWGGYTPPGGTHVAQRWADFVIKKYFYEDGEVGGVSELAIQSLERLAQRVHERGIQLVLVDTPAHERFRVAIPERHKLAYAALLKDLVERFPTIRIVNHADMALPDEWFYDPDHLNRGGGEAYSAILLETLTELLAEES
ncbi:MAG: hypothetical protein DRQ55_13285 [Planctomycetota bacterium]|nr:MAG: hypothetical protein DRQ55_13285 [Planctomycetota bacterium]